jgi:hypothetical protein
MSLASTAMTRVSGTVHGSEPSVAEWESTLTVRGYDNLVPMAGIPVTPRILAKVVLVQDN